MKTIKTLWFTGLLMLLAFGTCELFAQSIEPDVYQFGKVQMWNNPPATFRFRNTGAEEGMFLPTPYQQNLQIELPEGTIGPGEEAEIRVVYYTAQTGNLNISQTIYFSSSPEPMYIRLKGRIQSLHPNAITECPTVDKKPSELKLERGLAAITVYDEQTGLILTGVDLIMEGNGRKFLMENSRRNYIDLKGIPMGFYGLSISKTGYEELSSGLYLNANTGTITFKLRPIPGLIRDDEQIAHKPPQDDFTELELTPEDDIAAIERIRKLMDEKYKGKRILEQDVLVIREKSDSQDTDKRAVSTDTLQKETPLLVEVEQSELPDLDGGGRLNSEKYATNNVVFLIDVSGSMKIDNKIDKLKIAMKELVHVLRHEDLLTIITYSSRTEVLLLSCPGDEKDRIFSVIDGLIAKGNSFGAEGMQMAYSSARKNFIEQGNNQIILASDGLFNSKDVTEKDLYAMAAQQKQMGIGLSVVGFGRKSEARDFMIELANYGGGSFLEINSMDEVNYLLLREIMKQARKSG